MSFQKVPSQWVRAQQARLARLGLYSSDVDGLWGPATQAAYEAALAHLEKASGIEPPRYPGLPPAYRWLQDVQGLPLVTHELLKLLGIREIPGPKHSTEIMAWAQELGIARSVPSDEQAWCGLLAGITNKRAGKDISGVGNILGAQQWLKFGVPVDEPALGDTLVFWRGSPSSWQGHVGQYIAEDDKYWHVGGGNQSNAVSIMRIAKVQNGQPRLLGARRPVYKTQPAGVRPYRVAATGAISENEA